MGKVLIRKGSIITSVMGRPIEGNEDKTEKQQHVQLLQRCRLSKHTHLFFSISFTTNYPPLHSSGVHYPSILFQKNNRVTKCTCALSFFAADHVKQILWPPFVKCGPRCISGIFFHFTRNALLMSLLLIISRLVSSRPEEGFEWCLNPPRRPL